MLIGSPSVARSEWYDRSGEGIIERYMATLGPHVSTNRISYTVPVGKNAWLDSLQINMRRTTLPTTLGNAFAWLAYTPNGDVEWSILERLGRFPAVDDKEEFFTAALGLFFTGDMLKAYTSDDSIVGSVIYDIVMRLTLFDA